MNEQRPLNRIFFRLLWLQLFAPLLLSSLVIISLVAALAVNIFRDQQSKLNRSVRYNAESFLLDASNVLEMLAIRAASSDIGQVALSLEVVQRGYDYFDAFYYLDTNGRVLAMAPHEERYLGLDFSQQVYYRQAQQASGVIVSQPFVSLRSGRPAVYLAMNIPRSGVIAGELSLSELQRIASLSFDLEIETETFITDSVGNILAHPQIERVEQQENVGQLPILQQPRQIDRDMLYWHDGEPFAGSASVVQNSGWVVVSHARLRDVFRPYLGPVLLYVLISTLVLALFLRLFERQFEHTISRPLNRLSKAASEIASGNYPAAPLGDEGRPGFMELASLTESFIHMTDSVLARENRLNYMVLHDPLTDLANRMMLQQRLSDLIERARSHGLEFAVLFIDLDDFKTVNDAFGHSTGDRILKHIAALLVEAAGPENTVGRLGGDEFAVLVEDPRQAKQAGALAERILHDLTQPMQIEENEIYLSASIGISAFPLDGTTPDILIQNADTAMYQAKLEGKNTYQYYSLEMETRAQERHRLTTCLHHALEQEEFEVVYQPIFSTHTRQLVSCEALLRWNSHRLGSVSPARFIPLANETGLILVLGDWILRTACCSIRALADEGWPGLRVSVNVAERQLRNKNFTAGVRRALEESGLPPHLLTLELTENIFFQGFKEIDKVLLELKQMGVQLALDDFGMGYATLSCLTQIPFDEIKIDRSLSLNVTTSAGDAAIVRGIVRIAHDLGMPVVAEGIEDEDQIRFYEGLGCDMLQGYYFSRPLKHRDFVARLQGARK